jgi:hypothetical protein
MVLAGVIGKYYHRRIAAPGHNGGDRRLPGNPVAVFEAWSAPGFGPPPRLPVGFRGANLPANHGVIASQHGRSRQRLSSDGRLASIFRRRQACGQLSGKSDRKSAAG